MLPQIAAGDANKVWIIPGEFSEALGQLRSALGPGDGEKKPPPPPPPPG